MKAAGEGRPKRMSLVIDASITLAWMYAEEATEAVHEVFRRVKSAGAVAPPLWRLEVANVLEMNFRRGRHGRDFRDTDLLDLTQLRIRIDTDCEKFLWGATLELAERHRLTLYDAIYLELAKRLSLPLATLDRQLRSAATMEQVVLLGE